MKSQLFMALLLSLFLGPFMAVADPPEAYEIEILIQPRPNHQHLDQLARDYYQVDQWWKLSTEQKYALHHLVDPTTLGHVSIRIPNIDQFVGKTVGWIPKLDGIPTSPMEEARMWNDVIHRLHQTQLSFPIKYTSIKGHFSDDTEWASHHPKFSPIYSIKTKVTSSQLITIHQRINLFNESAEYQYQLLPDEAQEFDSRGRTLLVYPEKRFNCVLAIERLFHGLGVQLPFPYPTDGSIQVLVDIAKKYWTPLRTSSGACSQTKSAFSDLR